jgi:hypothetical protein
LALALGWKSIAALKRGMAEREFTRWQLYANKYRLPQRRIELYLAQVALWCARGPTSADVGFDEFLFDPPEDVVLDTFEATAEAMDFAPMN